MNQNQVKKRLFVLVCQLNQHHHAGRGRGRGRGHLHQPERLHADERHDRDDERSGINPVGGVETSVGDDDAGENGPDRLGQLRAEDLKRVGSRDESGTH